jgi:hypothetical protein
MISQNKISFYSGWMGRERDACTSAITRKHPLHWRAVQAQDVVREYHARVCHEPSQVHRWRVTRVPLQVVILKQVKGCQSTYKKHCGRVLQISTNNKRYRVLQVFYSAISWFGWSINTDWLWVSRDSFYSQQQCSSNLNVHEITVICKVICFGDQTSQNLVCVTACKMIKFS